MLNGQTANVFNFFFILSLYYIFSLFLPRLIDKIISNSIWKPQIFYFNSDALLSKKSLINGSFHIKGIQPISMELIF